MPVNPDDMYPGSDKYTWGDILEGQDIIDNPDWLYAGIENVQFGVDGATYEIELVSDRATEMRELLSPFIKAARIVRDERSKP
ncbi:Lsr2 [Actinobacteria bacterium OK074]|nr:Lsr2 [Actinobacteria bacterium OK074]